MKCLLVIAALVLTVTAQPPPPAQRCRQTPEMWTGLFFENDFVAQGNEPYIRFGQIHYDATAGSEKVRITEFDELSRPGRINRFKLDELYLFASSPPEGYIYNYETERCEPIQLRDDFRPFGVPEEATFRGRTWLGAENNTKLGLDVDHFYYSRTDEDSINHHYSSYWVPIENIDDCIPVEQHFINLQGPRHHDDDRPYDSRWTFMNITAVKSFPENTFTPLEACRRPPPSR